MCKFVCENKSRQKGYDAPHLIISKMPQHNFALAILCFAENGKTIIVVQKKEKEKHINIECYFDALTRQPAASNTPASVRLPYIDTYTKTLELDTHLNTHRRSRACCCHLYAIINNLKMFIYSIKFAAV